MQKIFAGLVVVALAALAAPVNASSTTYEKNLDYFASALAGIDANEIGVMPDGSSVTLAEAVALLAERAGSVDMGAIASGAAPSPTGSPVGDVWVFEYGTGACTATVIAPSPVPNTAFDPQLYTYAGGIGTLATDNGYYTEVIGWTTKEYSFTFNTAGFTATGQQDFFCIGFGAEHIAFPFIDGTATLN